MVDIDKMMLLKKKIEKLGQEKERAKGSVDQLLKMLKEKFGCSSLKKAKVVLKEKKIELEELENRYEKEEEKFMDRWGSKLELEVDE